jgi:hypothetical protein
MKYISDLNDDALLEHVQRATFRYFWDLAHPACGLARDRSTRDVVAIGGTGMAMMAIVIASERQWIARPQAIERLTLMLAFLSRAERHHGIYGHFYDGNTGAIYPFSRLDDGADLVETAFLAAGLLCVRQYFSRSDADERSLRDVAHRLWCTMDWSAHRKAGEDALMWHWSPNHGFATNHRITGWNECLLVYILTHGSPGHQLSASSYHKGWTDSPHFRNGKTYYRHDLPLGPPMGGPLFFAHYSFLGLDPRGLSDGYADYWRQNLHHTLINRAYCIDNPKRYAGYGEDCWGLTASDTVTGYAAHEPGRDLGVISPTAAISSMPYTPELSTRVIRHLLEYHPHVWSEFGFRDAFSPHHGWTAEAMLAIDQGPIIIMIENHRSGLIWNLMMSCHEIQGGLSGLGFSSPWLKNRAVALTA